MNTVSTGIASLDRVLGGGLQPGSLFIVAGPPGSGKTILAQQICFANATTERKALYYTTWSEPHDKLVRHLEPFSFFDADALGERVEFVHLPGLLESEGSGFADVADEIVRRSFESKPSVIVIDSSKALHDVVDPTELRRSIYDLASKVAYSDAVLMLVGEYGDSESRVHPEFAVADGILQLENESHGPVDRRWLRVLKMRGADIVSGRHSFQVSNTGFEVFPRLEAMVPAEVETQEGRAAFGEDGLDAAIGGGIPRGDSTLLLGPSGVGKTLLALDFLAAGIARGERCIHLSFQETGEQVRKKAAAAGWDWSGVSDEQLVIRQIPPVELDLDEVGAFIRSEVERAPAQRVVVDSVAELAFAARETERLPAYIWAITRFVRAAGGTTIFTNEMEALGRGSHLGGLSFLFDNVFFLRYIEMESELRRGLNVLKMRRSGHAGGLLSYAVDEHGLSFGEQLDGISGLLGWTALRGEL